MELIPVGIDIAKSVFQVRYIDQETGEIKNNRFICKRFQRFRPRCPQLVK